MWWNNISFASKGYIRSKTLFCLFWPGPKWMYSVIYSSPPDFFSRKPIDKFEKLVKLLKGLKLMKRVSQAGSICVYIHQDMLKKCTQKYVTYDTVQDWMQWICCCSKGICFIYIFINHCFNIVLLITDTWLTVPIRGILNTSSQVIKGLMGKQGVKRIHGAFYGPQCIFPVTD